MRIAQVAPLEESVPPRGYGGTERVVYWLTEELVRQGHEVTLYATADSLTSGALVPCAPEPLRLQRPSLVETMAMHVAMLERVLEDAPAYDVIHWHLEHIHLPLCSRLRTPSLTTLHGRLDLPLLHSSFRLFFDHPFVSISDSQRVPLPWVRFLDTVHHGMPTDSFAFSPEPAGYLLFLGRISPEKGPERAIEIAIQSGRPLIIAAKVDRADRAYFDERVKPLLSHPLVDFVGEVGERDKRRLLAGADALLFPIDWPEPFGLVMIESLATGTPVIAWPHGSVPEVIEDGHTGRLVSSVDEAVRAVRHLDEISRRACRAAFEERFSVERMVRDYLHLYRALSHEAESHRETAHDLFVGATGPARGDGHSMPGATSL